MVDSDENLKESAKKLSLRRTIAVLAGIVVLILVLVVAAIAVFGLRLGSIFDDNKSTVQAFPAESSRPAVSNDDSQTILLLGSDSRDGIDPEDINADQDSRSDVIMVVRIPQDREGIFVVSIMRDSWVEIPGFGMAKINAAMAFGGVPLTVQTVESLIGSRIDRVALVDFSGFKGLTDALGGVAVDNPGAFSTSKFDFPAGSITLNGDEALKFVQTRYPFEEGDYRRVQNQQAYLKGLISTVLSKETLSSPSKIQNSIKEISDFVTVDEGFDSGYVVGLLPSLRNVRESDIHFFTAPTAGVSTSLDGQSIVLLDSDMIEKLSEAFVADDLAGYSKALELSAF